ncbi:UNVERIFIED_CONTAM: putative toxin of predicted polymorphic toxin system [Lysinibacillus xylanilyticus]|nr:pre-toxin TG domain-containing protein [Lysinibacillus xylanilyticus]
MAKKGKGFFGALGSALCSIPVVGKVKKAAKKKIKKAKKKLKKALKKAKKKLKKKLGKVLTKARKLKNNLSKRKLVKRFKKAVKKAVKKAKKYVKKVVKTVKKAAKTAVKAVKTAAKTTVKAVKTAAKTAAKTTVKAVKTAAKATVKAVKTATKTLVQAKKNDVNVATKKASKAAASIVQKSKYINLENSCPVEQSVKKPGILLTLLSAIADFIPFLGNAKAGFEAYEGYDPITKKELDYTDRGIATAGIILGGFAKVAKGGKVVTELISEGKNATNVAETAIKGTGNLKPQGLMDELANSGVKYNPNDVVAVTKNADGKIVWLENGNSQAGFNHILNHADEFATKGINQSQLPEFITKAVSEGKIVGYQGKGTGRPIYEINFNGQTQRVAITTGSNGFIVGANPVSIK